MNIVELTENNMLSYAGAVNQSRAIPDARTGLKPIHRKILYEMYSDKIKSSGKYKKCAYMVGQIIARFSEHGDAATYDALVRLAQPWIQRYPLLDFHGNSGSQFGDPSAAMRYTEARLAKISEDGMLSNLDTNNVDWMPNFTNEEQEPMTLPAVFPGLFCLPNQGIGYATACNFLTFNLTDVANAIKEYIETQQFPIIYYDVASGGTFINPDIMQQIYNTGQGSVIIESKYYIKGQTIYITEIPFNVMFDDVMEEIITLVEKEEVAGIVDVRNNSGNGNLQMEIEISSAYNPQVVLNTLFQKTKLRTSYGINQVALVNNKPCLLKIQDMADIYIGHNIACIKREFTYKYEQTARRIHILEGLLTAINHIDEIIKLIKEDKIPEIQKIYDLTEIQIKAILDMKLSKLSKLEKQKLVEELQEKEKFLDYCLTITSSADAQKQLLLERLFDLVQKYDTPRRTMIEKKTIVKNGTNKQIKEEIPPEDVIVILNQAGYIKMVNINTFKLGRRGTAGITMQDTIIDTIKTNTKDMLVLLSNYGRLFRLNTASLVKCEINDKGTALGSILKLQDGEIINRIYSNSMNNGYQYLLFVTQQGVIKKSLKEEFAGTTRNLTGIQAIKLRPQDKVQSIQFINQEDVILITHNGYSIRFDSSTITPLGRVAAGVKGITLAPNDYVISTIVVNNDGDKIILTDNMYGKKIPLILFTPQQRGGKGSKCGNDLTAALLVKDDDKLTIFTDNKNLTLMVSAIPQTTKAAVGNKLVKTGNIVSICKV